MKQIKDLIELLTKNIENIRSANKSIRDDVAIVKNEYPDYDLSCIDNVINNIEDAMFEITVTIDELKDLLHKK